MINIVLYQPEIPQNTGNIARCCVANDLRLHLIKPLGFELSDKYLKRSGLDYWQHLDYVVHGSWEDFLCHCQESETTRQSRLWYLTTKTDKAYWDIEFQDGDYLVFGSETKGLPEDLMKQDWDRAITVPMFGQHSRSLNLASTVQTVAYEALRQFAVS